MKQFPEDTVSISHKLRAVFEGNLGSKATSLFFNFLKDKTNPMIRAELIIDNPNLSKDEKLLTQIKEETNLRKTLLSRYVINYVVREMGNDSKRVKNKKDLDRMTANYIKFVDTLGEEEVIMSTFAMLIRLVNNTADDFYNRVYQYDEYIAINQKISKPFKIIRSVEDINAYFR
ncbi:hypothetical protein FPHOBKDP_00013 [Listeria phage LPJP1]|nr:hypothetical protein FPHOBKDP_00013 [Listeria phage LPJP1]